MYKVTNKFRDKYTGQIYNPGDTFASDDPARINDLIDRKLIEGARKAPSYADLTKREIIELLNERGIDHDPKQTKAELIELLGGDGDGTS